MKILSAIIEYSVITLFACISIVYLFFSPITTPPDEIAHFAYPRHILIEQKIPSFKTAEDTWESHQPPLYYLASLPLVYGARNFPIESQLLIQRLTSLIFLIASLLIFRSILRRLFSWVAPRVFGLLALGLPSVLYASASFSNDISMVFCSTLLLYCLVSFGKKMSNEQAILLGCIIGISLLSKIQIYPLIALVGLYLLWKKNVQYWVLAALAALAISSWWFIHNSISVGDFFGLKNTFLLWQSQTQEIATVRQIYILMRGLFGGLIGVFGKFSLQLPLAIYLGALIFFLLGAIGSIRLIKKERLVSILGLCIIATILFVVVQNAYFFQPQGRYLLGVTPFFALLFAYCYKHFFKNIRPFLVLLPTLGILLCIHVVSLFIIFRHFEENPVTSFFPNRSVALTEQKWNGDKERITQTNGNVSVQTPATIFTLADFRMPSEHEPSLFIKNGNTKPFEVRVYWKILGQHTFSVNRSVTQDIFDEAEIRIPETDITLIQDIQLEIASTLNPVIIDSVILHSND